MQKSNERIREPLLLVGQTICGRCLKNRRFDKYARHSPHISHQKQLVHMVIHRRWGCEFSALTYLTQEPKIWWITMKPTERKDLLFAGLFRWRPDSGLRRRENLGRSFLEAIESGLGYRHAQHNSMLSVYRSRFLGHGCSHVGPDRWVAPLDDRCA